MNRARRRLTSVIEQISMSERRIPYMSGIYTCYSEETNSQIQICNNAVTTL